MNSEQANQFLRREAQLTAAGDREGAIKAVREAIAYCEQDLRSSPRDVNTVAFLASSYMKVGQLDEAIKSYRRAVALNPRIAVLHQNLGAALLHQSKLDEAEAPFRSAVALDPTGSSLSYSGLAQILLGRGDEKSAALMFRKAYDCQPNTPAGMFFLGRALIHEGKLEEAENAFRQAIALRPRFADACRLLGQVLQQLGKFADAEEVLRTAVELDPMRGHVYLSIVTGRKITPDDVPFIDQMRALVNHGQMLIADECSIHYALGKSLNDLGEYRLALEEYDKANRLALKTNLQDRPFDREMLELRYRQSEALFTKEFFARYQPLGSNSETPIFVIGMMRSGTTLLEQILSRHPQIAAGGELPFWTKEGLSLLDPSLHRVEEDRVPEVQAAYLSVLDAHAGEKSRVIDKRPGNYGVLGLIHLAFPKAKIIHCMRDPVDTALSIYMTPMALVEFGHVRENIVFAYRDYQRLMALYRSVLPPNTMLDVRYEELVANPDQVIPQIIDFLGLDWSEACLHHEENEAAVRTPSVWQARQPLYSTSVRRWKNYEPWLAAFKDLIDSHPVAHQ